MLTKLNRRHQASREGDSRLEARIASCELAANDVHGQVIWEIVA